MSFEPIGWNTVVLGAWNRAILTPEWIAREIFHITDDRPVPVEVPLNVRGPWRVRHGDVAVVVSNFNLDVSIDKYDFDTLELSRTYAIAALETLSRTPVSAAGYNLRFQSTEMPAELGAAVQCGLDSVFSDYGLQIENQSVRRSMPFEGGFLNVEVIISQGGDCSCSFNFHKSSVDADDLKAWLRIPMQQVGQIVDDIIRKLPGVTT